MGNNKNHPRNVAIFLDGTWNDPEDHTNVFNLYEQAIGPDVRHRDPDDETKNASQIRYYDKGVHGIIGGATGYGLSKDIREAYRFLCQHFMKNDQIFIFGFSRGAYTARSLVGMIDAVGLLPKKHLKKPIIQAAMDTYKANHISRNEIKHLQNVQDKFKDDWDCRNNVRIHFLGVWDTVGALGIPQFGSSRIQHRDYHTMHNTEMSCIVDHAYHAMAIDEHREVFQHTPWTKINPKNIEVKQRWFVGAHSNVGGGTRDNKLNLIPLTWMQDLAEDKDLELFRRYEMDDDLYLEPISDSYSAFAFGLYRRFISKKYHRLVDINCNHEINSEGLQNPQDNGSVNENIHESVWKYMAINNHYRPRNIPMNLRPEEGKNG